MIFKTIVILTYHDCEKNHNYKVVTMNDNKLASTQQIMFDYT